MDFDEQPAEGVHTYWVIYDDGSLGRVETGEDEPPALSKPGRFVTEDEYAQRLNEIQQAREQRLAEEEAARLAEARSNYDALIAAGIPPAVASSLSGYTPDPEES